MREFKKKEIYVSILFVLFGMPPAFQTITITIWNFQNFQNFIKLFNHHHYLPYWYKFFQTNLNFDCCFQSLTYNFAINDEIIVFLSKCQSIYLKKNTVDSNFKWYRSKIKKAKNITARTFQYFSNSFKNSCEIIASW